jgi:hypothetical protein
MSVRLDIEKIGKKLHRLLIYVDGQYIGEYERSQEADIGRKEQEIHASIDVLVGVCNKYGEFVVRWDGTNKKKSIRVKESLNNVAIPSNRTLNFKNSALDFQDEAGFA